MNIFKLSKLCLFLLVISINAYSQKEDCLGRCFYCTEKNVIYTDSTIIDGITVYTDSLMVKVSVVYTDSIETNGTVFYTDSSITYSPMNYHIVLKDSSPFTAAIYRNDCEFIYLLLNSISMMELNKCYFIFSSDKKYIKYALIRDVNSKLYAIYNPIKKDNNVGISFSLNNDKNIIKWIQNEIDKGKIVSFGCKNKRRYICKSFDMDSVRIIDNYTSTNFNDTQTWAHQQMGKDYKVDINYNKETKEYIAIIK